MTKWTIDPAHTELGFKVKHMMISNVSGKFTGFGGEIETDGDNFETAKANFTVNTSTIDTGSADRDTHLKSPDFFDAEKFDKISFRSTGMKKESDGDYILNGDLTIKDVTKPVKLKAEHTGLAKDPWGNMKAGFSINGTINRKDFGLTWNAVLESGGVLVSDDVKMNIELQLIKQA
jgi:polyisoprenoid-binding protein YceI